MAMVCVSREPCVSTERPHDRGDRQTNARFFEAHTQPLMRRRCQERRLAMTLVCLKFESHIVHVSVR